MQKVIKKQNSKINNEINEKEIQQQSITSNAITGDFKEKDIITN